MPLPDFSNPPLPRLLPAALGALRHRDFRLFWLGAFLSFCGSWIQITGQQYLVYELTGSKAALGLVTFFGSAPMFFLSPLGGWFADRCNKRKVLVWVSALFGVNAFVLALSLYFHFVSYPLICGCAIFGGCLSVLEIPTRQSMISNLVPPDEIGQAIPLNAATFNSARIIGPSIGGPLLTYFGPEMCYLVNAISFIAIIFAVLAIRADLKSLGDRSASLKESLFDGMRYVMLSPAFRTLASMMALSAICALFYVSQAAPLAKSLHMNEKGYSLLFTCTGVGALIGILVLAFRGSNDRKGIPPLLSMSGLGLSLIALSFVTEPWQAYTCFFTVGLFGSGQMVGTNTALQYFAPPELRGRVISVHAWTLAGMSPLGALLFGWICEHQGLSFAFRLGGSITLLVAVLVLIFGSSVRNLGRNSGELIQ